MRTGTMLLLVSCAYINSREHEQRIEELCAHEDAPDDCGAATDGDADVDADADSDADTDADTDLPIDADGDGALAGPDDCDDGNPFVNVFEPEHPPTVWNEDCDPQGRSLNDGTAYAGQFFQQPVMITFTGPNLLVSDNAIYFAGNVATSGWIVHYSFSGVQTNDLQASDVEWGSIFASRQLGLELPQDPLAFTDEECVSVAVPGPLDVTDRYAVSLLVHNADLNNDKVVWVCRASTYADGCSGEQLYAGAVPAGTDAQIVAAFTPGSDFGESVVICAGAEAGDSTGPARMTHVFLGRADWPNP